MPPYNYFSRFFDATDSTGPSAERRIQCHLLESETRVQQVASSLLASPEASCPGPQAVSKHAGGDLLVIAQVGLVSEVAPTPPTMPPYNYFSHFFDAPDSTEPSAERRIQCHLLESETRVQQVASTLLASPEASCPGPQAVSKHDSLNSLLGGCRCYYFSRFFDATDSFLAWRLVVVGGDRLHRTFSMEFLILNTIHHESAQSTGRCCDETKRIAVEYQRNLGCEV